MSKLKKEELKNMKNYRILMRLLIGLLITHCLLNFSNIVIADTFKSENKEGDITVNDRGSAYKLYKSIGAFYLNKTTAFSYPSPKRRKLNEGDLKYLIFFPEIIAIHLSDQNLTDSGIYYFKDLRNLQAISFDGTKITDDGLKFLKNAKKLNTIRLDNTKITDLGLKYLSEIDFEGPVMEMDLSSTKITDDGLKYLEKITFSGVLILRNTAITDAGLKYLAGQKKVYEIDLRNTKVTKTGAEWLRQKLKNTSVYYGKYVKEEW
jgi:hypothetical protein